MGLSGNADPIQTLRILRNSSLEFLSRHGVVGLLSSYSIIENYFESKDQVAEDGLLVLSAKAFAHIYALISEWEESKKKK